MAENRAMVVCFDLGGVVVRICRSFGEACHAAGIEHRSPERFSAPELRAARGALHADYQTGRIGCEAFFEGVARHSAGLYGADEFRAIHDAWILGEYRGIAGLVSALNDLGLRTACLSNTNHRHWLAMRRQLPAAAQAGTAALGLIHHRLASHELGLAKPNAAIYERFERTLGVRGDGIVFFDDLDENVDAARARGWRAHRIDHLGDTVAQMITHLEREGVDAVGSERAREG